MHNGDGDGNGLPSPADEMVVSRSEAGPCDTVELDKAWVTATAADHVVFSRNIHETRAYNKLVGPRHMDTIWMDSYGYLITI